MPYSELTKMKVGVAARGDKFPLEPFCPGSRTKQEQFTSSFDPEGVPL